MLQGYKGMIILGIHCTLQAQGFYQIVLGKPVLKTTDMGREPSDKLL